MIRAAARPRYRRRAGLAVLGQLAALSLIAVLAPQAALTQDPYEPNDTIQGAVGPLANHQSYAAGLETENDKDFFFFFFYVTSPLRRSR